MVLDSAIKKKILDYVYKEPRTVQEVALYLTKNWKTAERYVNQIAKEDGSLLVKTFRGGTRGALKVVFWANAEKISSNDFQEKLFKKIELGRKKIDFSPLDIYQYVENDKREAYIDNKEKSFGKDFLKVLESANEQILCFSGNISWIDYDGVKELIEKLMKKNVKLKIVSRVDIASTKNIDLILDIQNKLGKDLVEIRHSEQPLRGFIIDNEIARLKEVKNPKDYKDGELENKTRIIYDIKDREWIEWMSKVFYNLFRHSIDHKKRINDIKSINL